MRFPRQAIATTDVRFSALDFLEYQHRKLNPEILKARLSEMAQLGVKSVMFAGEGEPTLYPELPEILDYCSNIGIDTSLTTNMVPFTEKNTENFVKNCKWIKVSINAGNPKTYAAIHRCAEKDFDRVIDNMKKAVALKQEKGYDCTIGAKCCYYQTITAAATELAQICQETGLDYLVIKPYSQHLSSVTDKYKEIDYSQFLYLEDELKKFNTDAFKVIYRKNTIEKLINHENRYSKCNATPFFWAYIMSEGSVYGCSAFLEKRKLSLRQHKREHV
ncbi:MAG: radical SAM protein [Ignavibacteriales bacterium]|nr:radical SAM protein [Ignavibacteriales bacterium]